MDEQTESKTGYAMLVAFNLCVAFFVAAVAMQTGADGMCRFGAKNILAPVTAFVLVPALKTFLISLICNVLFFAVFVEAPRKFRMKTVFFHSIAWSLFQLLASSSGAILGAGLVVMGGCH